MGASMSLTVLARLDSPETRCPDRPLDGHRQTRDPAAQLTLLELVRAVGEVTEDEAEVVATVLHLLRSGRVRLTGNFRGVPPELLAD